MSRRAPRHDVDEHAPRGRGAEEVGGGAAGGGDRDEARGRADGRASYGADAAAAQPGRRVRLPGLRVARSRPEPPAHRGVLRERRQGGHRGGDPAPGRAQLLRRSTRSRTCATRPTTGSVSRAGSPSRWCCAPGSTHYEPIAWDQAFELMGGLLNGLASPDEAVFYTSGKVSNEAAFAYQLFARAYGTNNLPDCSNMCHESSGVGLAESIGIGKGSVSLEDIHDAKLIVIAGQNPGTNHPRMLSALEIAKQQRRQDHLGQPAARGRAGPLQEPAEGARSRRPRHRPLRPAPAGPDQRRPRALPGDRVAPARVGRARPRLHRRVHARASRSGRRTCASSTGTPYAVRRVSTGPRSWPRPGCSRSPTPR